MIRAGLVGKKVPSYDSRWDEKGRTMISHIFVSFSEFITCVQFGYLKDEALVLSETFGFSEGSFRTVRLNQDEYVTGLSGVVTRTGRIINLTFNTNRGKHGPIGRSSDDSDTSCSNIEIDPAISDRSEFSGFFGSYNSDYLSAIGIYVSPTPMTGTVVKRSMNRSVKKFDCLKDCKREINVGVRNRSEFGGFFGSFSESLYGGYLRSIGMYVSHNRISIDAVPRTRFGATYDHQFIPLEPFDHTTTRLHYQTPKIVDGFPVKPSRVCKTKLKDRILSKINKAIRFLIDL
ncbi:hypothetical protein N665_0600s0004 [Sinapis alba]|nr:hypothetical protein N665_0600s0004 [Sinapis alba]